MPAVTCQCGQSVEVDAGLKGRPALCSRCGRVVTPPPSPSLPPGGEPMAQITEEFVASPIQPGPATTLAASPSGTIALGSYTILRQQGKGGMGRVSVARDEPLQREVALKELLDSVADDPLSRRRFVEEAEITGQLEHPGIVPVYALGMDSQGRPFYAMRLVRGKTLKAAIDDYHQHPTAAGLRALLRRFVMVGETMAYAHARGMIHRDLKPSNIMLGDFGETLVLDWGLAKPMAADGRDDSTRGDLAARHLGDRVDLTEPGCIVGTPAYMSPEQARESSTGLTAAADIYSLGAVLYQVLTGKPAYVGRSSAEVLEKVRTVPPASPASVLPSVPRALEAICLKAMNRQTDLRHSSARALAQDVQNWLDDEPVAAYDEPFVDRALRWARRHKTPVVAMIAAGICLVLALLVGTAVVSKERARTAVAEEMAAEYARQAEEALEQASAKEQEAERLQSLATQARAQADVAAQLAYEALRAEEKAKARIALIEGELKAKTERTQELHRQLEQTRAEIAAAVARRLAETARAQAANQKASSLEQQAAALRREVQELRQLAAQAQQMALRARGRVDGARGGDLAEQGGGATDFPDASDPNAPRPAIVPFDASAARQFQETWAQHLRIPVEQTNSIGMKFRLLPPGAFEMGFSEAEIADMIEQRRRLAATDPSQSEGADFVFSLSHAAHPPHRVVLTKPLLFGCHEVTVGQFKQFVGDAGYRTEAERDGKGGRGFDRPAGNLVATNANFVAGPQYTWKNVGWAQTDDHPVLNVSVDDCREFCRWLSAKEAKVYRLPTEAQWEFACRSGAATPYWTGETWDSIQGAENVPDAAARAVFPYLDPLNGSHAWNDGYTFTAPVGTFKPNPFGLYDMNGNVAELCADWYAPDYYRWSPRRDPAGPSLGHKVAWRGGWWYVGPPVPSFRGSIWPHSCSEIVGFRLVCEVTPRNDRP